MKIPSILVVDDDLNNFTVIKILLSNHDYKLNYVSNGQEVLSSMDLYQPDLILLDVMMPIMNGIEVCRQLKSTPEWAHIPIIMVTALTSKNDLAQCLEAGATDFISKPLDRTELNARVRSMLQIKQQYDRIKSLSEMQEHTIDLLQCNINDLCGNLSSTLPIEINTPLSGVLGALTILIDDHANMSKSEISDWLITAQTSVARLEKLTKKFMRFARLEIAANNPKKKPPIPSELPIPTAVLASIAIKSKSEIFNRKDDLIMELEDIESDIEERDFLTIIDELLDNAFKFSKSGTPVKVTTESENGMFNLSVLDHGRGMTEEQIAKIGAFYQFERKQYGQEGLGLGLKIVKRIVEMNAGHFSVSSVYNLETKVHIQLPLSKPNRASTGALPLPE